mgnify:CR=1 FL=1
MWTLGLQVFDYIGKCLVPSYKGRLYPCRDYVTLAIGHDTCINTQWYDLHQHSIVWDIEEIQETMVRAVMTRFGQDKYMVMALVFIPNKSKRVSIWGFGDIREWRACICNSLEGRDIYIHCLSHVTCGLGRHRGHQVWVAKLEYLLGIINVFSQQPLPQVVYHSLTSKLNLRKRAMSSSSSGWFWHKGAIQLRRRHQISWYSSESCFYAIFST